MEGALVTALGAADRSQAEIDALNERCRARAKRMFAACTEKQKELILDRAPLVSCLTPRRTGKSFAATMMALITGESRPGSITIIMSLTERSVKGIYWKDGPSGIIELGKKFGLNLEINNSEMKWWHENGSVGYLRNAETLDSMEKIRGLEADVYIIDECKSFSPVAINTLIDDILVPQRASRDGKILLIGTPGHIKDGEFFKATSPTETDKAGQPFSVPYGVPDQFSRDPRQFWSFHQWTLQDNTSKPGQWESALFTKAQRHWEDDHPTWMSEYMGKWAVSTDGLVYELTHAILAGVKATWNPERTRENPTGLDPDHGEWRMVMGVDIGWHDATAVQLLAYSQKTSKVVHVYEFSKKHMTPSDVAAEMADIIKRFGRPDRIFMDTGGLGKSISEEFIARYGLPVERASKTDKIDHISMLNGDIRQGQVHVIEGSKTQQQMEGLQWDTSRDSIERLAKKGQLREDRNAPNDLCDAFLYAYRGCMHYFEDLSSGSKKEPPRNSPQWWAEFEDKVELEERKRNAAGTDPLAGDLPRGPLQDELPGSAGWSLRHALYKPGKMF